MARQGVGRPPWLLHLELVREGAAHIIFHLTTLNSQSTRFVFSSTPPTSHSKTRTPPIRNTFALATTPFTRFELSYPFNHYFPRRELIQQPIPPCRGPKRAGRTRKYPTPAVAQLQFASRTHSIVFSPSILGADPGSTGSRFFLLSRSGKKFEVECNLQESEYIRNEPGEIPSTCYPFGDGRGGKVYMDNKVDYGRTAASIKPIFIVLADLDLDTIKSLLSEYPHADKILKRLERQDTRFQKNLKAAIDGYCKFVKGRIVATCEFERLRVVSVGIATPTQWPEEVEEFMAEMFLQKVFRHPKCFDVSRRDIVFHSETQALAHYVFAHVGTQLQPPGVAESDILFLDFGGQNLVSSITSWRRSHPNHYHALFMANAIPRT